MDAFLARLPNDYGLIGLGLLTGLIVGWLLTWAVSARSLSRLRRRNHLARARQLRRIRRLEQIATQTNDHLNQARAEREILAMRLNAAGGHIQNTQRANSRQLTHFAAQLRNLARLDRERGRLLRSAFDRGEQDARQVDQLQLRIRRQNLALDALSDALEHAKRAQRVADQRRGLTGRFEGRDGDEGLEPTATGRAAGRGHGPGERIVEVPVERVVYRDREVRVEVPFDVPRNLSPRPSNRRPSARGPAGRGPAPVLPTSAPGRGPGGHDPALPPPSQDGPTRPAPRTTGRGPSPG